MSLRKTERSKNVQVSLNPRIQALFHHESGNEPKFHRRLEKIHTNPAIFLVRNFLSPVDLDYLDRNITQHASKFKASYTEDENGRKCISEERTSTYIFLDKGRDTIIRNMEMRASDLISLSSDFVEPLQIVSYTDGQKFDLHHDAGTLTDEGDIELVEPRRLVTLFLYLNNLPKGQGCTEFPSLNLKVTPERGCGILFCNVMPNGDADPRTAHRACPVGPGLRKFGMNVWMAESSMLHMKTKSNISGIVLVSKKDFEAERANSALSNAENMTKQYQIAHEGEEGEGNEEGGREERAGAEQGDMMTTVHVRAPHNITNWMYLPGAHESLGLGVAGEFEMTMVEEEIEDDDDDDEDYDEGGEAQVPSSVASRNREPSSMHPNSGGVADIVKDREEEDGEKEGGDGEEEAPVTFSQVFEGRVLRYAPPPSPLKGIEEERGEGRGGGDAVLGDVEEGCLYEVLWSDGALTYLGAAAYRNARTLFEKVQLEKHAKAEKDGEIQGEGESRKRKLDVSEGLVAGVKAEGLKLEGLGVAREDLGAMDVAEEEMLGLDQDAEEDEEEDGNADTGDDEEDDDDDNDDEDGSAMEREAKRAKIDLDVRPLFTPRDVSHPSQSPLSMSLPTTPAGHALLPVTSSLPVPLSLSATLPVDSGDAALVAAPSDAAMSLPMRSKYSVPYETVLKWRGKKGVDLEYLLGCGVMVTHAEQARAVDVLNVSGKLICILCNQTISGTRKSLQKHQLTKRHQALHAEVCYLGRPPTADLAMQMEMPPPSEPIVYMPYSIYPRTRPVQVPPHHIPALPSAPSSSSAAAVAYDPSLPVLDPIIKGDGEEEDLGLAATHNLQPNLCYTSPSSSGYVVDASTMATSLEVMKSWRDKRSINVDYVLGCSETATLAEQQRAEKILLTSLKIICILCNQTVAANKKSLRRHQRESKRHMSMSHEIETGRWEFPSSAAAMSMPTPPPAVREVDGSAGDRLCTSSYLYPNPQLARPLHAASTFSVTMPCALAWKERTGLDTEFLLGICEGSSKVERDRAEVLLVQCGKLICILCNQTLAGNRKSVYKHMLTKKHVGQCSDVKSGLKPYPTTEAAMCMEVPLPPPLPTSIGMNTNNNTNVNMNMNRNIATAVPTRERLESSDPLPLSFPPSSSSSSFSFPLEQPDVPSSSSSLPLPPMSVVGHKQTPPPLSSIEGASAEFFAYSAACVAVEDSDSEAE